HRLLAAEVGDVDALDDTRRLLQPQHLAQADEALLRLDLEDLRLHVLVDLAAQAERLERLNVVTHAGGLLEEEGLAGLLHVALHLAEEPVLLARQHQPQGADLLAVLLLGDAEVTRGRTLPNIVENAGAEPAPAFVLRVDVEGAGAELEDALQHLDGGAEALGAGERAVELDAAPPRRARE